MSTEMLGYELQSYKASRGETIKHSVTPVFLFSVEGILHFVRKFSNILMGILLQATLK